MVEDYFYDALKANGVTRVIDNGSAERVGTSMSNLLKQTEKTMREFIVKD